jgi:hypothetical protein
MSSANGDPDIGNGMDVGSGLVSDGVSDGEQAEVLSLSVLVSEIVRRISTVDSSNNFTSSEQLAPGGGRTSAGRPRL